jgi:hypothetical protein
VTNARAATASASAANAGAESAALAFVMTKGATPAMKMKPMKDLMNKGRPPAVLRFSPTAWAKLLYLRDVGETEIGGFGISAADDLLFVEDVRLVGQTSDWASVSFDDESVADYFDAEVDAGRRPEQFFRLFLHTHPANSPQPSPTDEATFARVFGRTEWAVMFILARGGKSYARLRYNMGPGIDAELPVEVDYSRPFASSDESRWQEEYFAKVRKPSPVLKVQEDGKAGSAADSRELSDYDSWFDAWADYESFEPHASDTLYGFTRNF